jgi:hypothetical protein
MDFLEVKIKLFFILLLKSAALKECHLVSSHSLVQYLIQYVKWFSMLVQLLLSES